MNVQKYKDTLFQMDSSMLDNEMQVIINSTYVTEEEIKLRCKLIIDVKQNKFGQK